MRVRDTATADGCVLPHLEMATATSGCPVPTVLVFDSWTWLDAWRVVPVEIDPSYVWEMRLVSKPSASDGVTWRGQAAQTDRGKATILVAMTPPVYLL